MMPKPPAWTMRPPKGVQALADVETPGPFNARVDEAVN